MGIGHVALWFPVVVLLGVVLTSYAARHRIFPYIIQHHWISLVTTKLKVPTASILYRILYNRHRTATYCEPTRSRYPCQGREPF